MASALRNWFYGPPAPSIEPTPSDAPTIVEVPPAASDDEQDDDGEETEREDDDRAPAFPALNSAQRASGSPAQASRGSELIPSILSGKDDSAGLMPPPPNPALASRTPGVGASAGGSGAGNTLMLPPSTTKVPPLQSKKRAKVALAPGFGPLDWASLKSSGADLRGVGHPGLLRVTPSQLKEHRTKDDAWSAFGGKVYNITPYLPYHPGGEKDLMRVAGRDGTKLFMSTHAWVNADYMLDGCLIGYLVPE